MKIVLSSAVLASVMAPAFSFSYLDQLGSNPVSHSPMGGASPSNGASYLDALTSPVSTGTHGTGMSSYLDNIGGGTVVEPPAPAAPAPAAPAPVAAAPVAPSTAFEEPVDGGVIASTSGYLGHLDTGAHVSGPGIRSYLDTVHRNAPTAGGAGIPTYKDALAVTNVVSGTGAGLNTYTDNLSGGSKPSKSYSPFAAGKPAAAASSASFSGSAGGQEIGFTLEASDLSELVKSMSSGGTIRLSGSIDNVSFN